MSLNSARTLIPYRVISAGVTPAEITHYMIFDFIVKGELCKNVYVASKRYHR